MLKAFFLCRLFLLHCDVLMASYYRFYYLLVPNFKLNFFGKASDMNAQLVVFVLACNLLNDFAIFVFYFFLTSEFLETS